MPKACDYKRNGTGLTKSHGTQARDVGVGRIGLYKRPKTGKPTAYSRKAPNYHANTDTVPGSDT